MLLNTRGDECARLWRRVDGIHWNSPSFHAVSLETVRPLKYDVSSLTDFVSELLHCYLVLRPCCHDGRETVVSTTLRATLWKLSRFDGVKRRSSRFTVAVSTRIHTDFHTIGWDNQPVDSFPGVVSVRGHTVLNGIPQLRHAALVLRLVINITVHLVHPGHDAWRLGPADD